MFPNDEIKYLKREKIEEIIIKNCEEIPTSALCNIFENLLNQKLNQKNNIKRVLGSINNWYQAYEHQFSGIENFRIIENPEKISFNFYPKEPKLKHFTVITNGKKKIG